MANPVGAYLSGTGSRYDRDLRYLVLILYCTWTHLNAPSSRNLFFFCLAIFFTRASLSTSAYVFGSHTHVPTEALAISRAPVICLQTHELNSRFNVHVGSWMRSAVALRRFRIPVSLSNMLSVAGRLLTRTCTTITPPHVSFPSLHTKLFTLANCCSE